MKKQDKRLSALINLLQDDDDKVASLAMEQLLELGSETDRAIAENQDSGNPKLRQRIHQLSGILARRRLRRDFVEDVMAENMTLWEGVCRINELYDFQCSRRKIHEGLDEILKNMQRKQKLSMINLAAAMRNAEYMVPGEDVMDVEMYLIETVVETGYGSGILLCALAHEIGARRGLSSTLVLHEGQYCLADADGLLLNPLTNWELARIEGSESVHPCTPRDVWIGILSQLFIVALVEGQLHDLSHLGGLLTALNGDDLDALPYPLGKNEDSDK